MKKQKTTKKLYYLKNYKKKMSKAGALLIYNEDFI
jgi:hypothetical protein